MNWLLFHVKRLIKMYCMNYNPAMQHCVLEG